MVKLVDMREALEQVREKAPNTADAMKRFKSGNAGFTDKAHLKAKGLIPRADGTKKVSPKYESDAYDNNRYMMKKYMGQVLARVDNSNTKDSKDHVYAPNAQIAKQLYKQGKKVYREDLDKGDEKTIKPIIKQLKKSVIKHDKQAKTLEKDIADEKDLEEQVADLENQIAEAKKELEEIRLSEEQAHVIRFKRIKDKERMVVVFRNKHDADMYADNIKKQGGQVFSNKLERVPLGMKLKSEEMNLDETITAVKNKAKKTGMPYSILKKVYDRGMAAWKGGHRPGATQQQWALARVNSFVTKSSGTWGGADKDLAKQVRGSK
jgi:predicted DNA binding CopG/RHH family protein